ncbi:MAG TPA: glycosyltransferase [Acetobacteraceae bacterium]|jgi:glycosyltransferase involved in cell wall biosynthesis|nr:glycosyltransferase [Acetobacteraceae bacterium]
MPFFSVVMATRNRPTLFGEALRSVLAQSCPEIEIIVVNDGSAPEHGLAYAAILEGMDTNRVRALALVPRPSGHGPSYALNAGAAEATAPYLCFLDDDDCWTDPGHLARAHAVLADQPAPVDLYLANQAAFLHGEQRPGPIWIEDLSEILTATGNRPDDNGAHTVGVAELLQSSGFCHLNTLIVRRALYQEIGGMDENIRWEGDRDLYLRLIDRAAAIKYAPVTVSRHNIPDPAKTANMTTAISELEKRLFQLRVLDRAALFARHPAIRAHGRRHKAYALKKIAESLAEAGRAADSAAYAREALGAGPTLKWAGYTAWLTLRSLGRN